MLSVRLSGFWLEAYNDTGKTSDKQNTDIIKASCLTSIWKWCPVKDLEVSASGMKCT